MKRMPEMRSRRGTAARGAGVVCHRCNVAPVRVYGILCAPCHAVIREEYQQERARRGGRLLFLEDMDAPRLVRALRESPPPEARAPRRVRSRNSRRELPMGTPIDVHVATARGRVLVAALTTATPGLCVHPASGDTGWAITHISSGTRIARCASQFQATMNAHKLGAFANWLRSGLSLQQDEALSRRIVAHFKQQGFQHERGRVAAFRDADFPNVASNSRSAA